MLRFVTIFCAISSGLADKAPSNYGGPSGQQPSYGQPTYGNGPSADEENLKMLMNSIPGTPGEDYPIFSEVPESEFTCKGQKVGGYYADPEAQCQVFHICAEDGDGPRSKWSFLCPNGTIFNQNYFICDWWFNFDCSTAEDLYSLNDQLGEGLATYNAAESQDVPSYSSGNQPSYQNSKPAPAPAPKKAPAPKPKNGKPNGKSAKPQSPKGNYGAPSAPSGNNYGAPAGNNYGAPSAPAAGSYGAPASSSYGSPAGSSYGGPSSDQSSGSNYGAPTNGNDDLPDYSSSASDNYGAPAGSEYGAPAGDSYGAPEAPQGDYTSSGRTGRQRNGKSAFGRRG